MGIIDTITNWFKKIKIREGTLYIILSIVSVLCYTLLPMPYDVIISFLIPAIIISNKFKNIYVFIGLLLLFSFLPSNFMTLDITNVYYVPPEITGFMKVIETIAYIVLIGVPSIMVVMIIGAGVTAQWGELPGLVLKTAVILLIEIGTLWIFNKVGIPFFNFEDKLRENWEAISGWIDSPDSAITNLLSAVETPKKFAFTSFLVLPVILSFLVVALGFLINVTPKEKKEKLDKFFGFIKQKNEANFKTGGIDTSSITVIIFMLFILIGALTLSLSYRVEDLLLYQNQLYFGIYLTITLFCCIMMIIGVSKFTKNSKQTIFGVIIGISGLFIFFNLFAAQRTTFDMLSLEYNDIFTVNKIISQFLFVAPTESLLFHVFMPGFILYLMQVYNKRYDKTKIERSIEELDLKKMRFQLESDIYENKNDKQKYIAAKNNLFDVEVEIKKKRDELDKSIIDTTTEITTTQYIVYFIAIIIINMLFAMMHWFNSGLELGIFFNSGLFLMYLSAGVWLAYMSYRFGWLTSIIVHALNNSLPLLLLLIAM